MFAMTGVMMDISGARMWVDRVGQGPDIVLVHAGIADSTMWDEHIAILSDQFRITRYDLRGFGRSSMPPVSYSHVDDLAELFGVLEIEDAIVVGASFGGNVATEFAIVHADKTRGLVLVNTLVACSEYSDYLRRGWDEVDALESAGDITAAVELELQMWVDGPHRTPEDVDPVVRERVRSMNTEIFQRSHEHEAATEIEFDPAARHRLNEIGAPTLIIVGELDVPDALTSARTLATSISNAHLKIIADAAHLPSMEAPEVFSEMLLEFVLGLD